MFLRYSILLLLLCLCSCSSKEDKNSLIIPPNFAQVPDLNKKDDNDISKENRNAQIIKLKELLIESEN